MSEQLMGNQNVDESQKLEAIQDAAWLEAVCEEQNKSFTPIGAGEKKGSLENGVLAPSKNKQSIIFDGKAGTKGVIPDVDNIWLIVNDGILYDFTIWVHGAGPKKGLFSTTRMTFTDRSGDTYTLNLYSSIKRDHFLNYHSSDPAIVRITWDIS